MFFCSQCFFIIQSFCRGGFRPTTADLVGAYVRTPGGFCQGVCVRGDFCQTPVGVGNNILQVAVLLCRILPALFIGTPVKSLITLTGSQERCKRVATNQCQLPDEPTVSKALRTSLQIKSKECLRLGVACRPT